jgi:hypothetical protein
MSGDHHHKTHLGNNVFDIKYVPRQRKFRLGLSGTFREFGPQTIRNTLAMTKPAIDLTRLFLWNAPAAGQPGATNYPTQFESISNNVVFRLDN